MKIKEGFNGERSLVLPKAVVDTIGNDPLASALFITDIGYYPCAAHHFRSRREPVGQYVFIYCVDGAGWYEVDGRRYDVRPDTYFILPAGLPHAYAADTLRPWTIYWIHFRGTLAPHYAAGCTGPQEVAPSAESRISNRIGLFEEIYNTLTSSLTIESIRYAMAAFQHFLATLRYLQPYRAAQGGKGAAERGMLESAMHYLEENLERHLTLAQLAEYVGYSPSRLSAVFRQHTGHAPMAYFNILKIRQACLLLDTTDMRLNQISYKLGITDPYYFSRLFSRIMGLSPRAYRLKPKA